MKNSLALGMLTLFLGTTLFAGNFDFSSNKTQIACTQTINAATIRNCIIVGAVRDVRVDYTEVDDNVVCAGAAMTPPSQNFVEQQNSPTKLPIEQAPKTTTCYAVPHRMKFWSQGTITSTSRPLARYYTDKGEFMVYSGDGLQGFHLKGPIKFLPNAPGCTDSEAFEEHLRDDCGFIINKIERF